MLQHITYQICFLFIFTISTNLLSAQETKPIGIYEAAVKLHQLPSFERFNPENEKAQAICNSIGLSVGDIVDESFLFLSPKGSETNIVGNATSIGSKFASLPVTNLADGLSIFLVDRAKQELSAAFFNRLNDRINELPFLAENFPFTSMQLKTLGDDIYQFEKYIQSLRQAFTADLKGLPGHFGQYLMGHPHLILIDSIRAIAGDGLHTMQSFIQGKDISGLVHYLASDSSYVQSLSAKKLQTLKGILKTTDLILHAFQNQDGSWVDFNDFNKMLQNEDQLNVFIGLLLAKAEKLHIKFKDDLTFQALIKDQALLRREMSAMLFQVNQLITYGKLIKQHSAEQPLEDYYHIMSSMFSILESGYRIFPADKLDDSDLIKNFYSSVKSLSTMTLFVYQKKYSSAITEISNVLNQLLLKEHNRADRKLDKAWEKAMRYANFFALIAEAENGTAVANVIDQFAAPVGSSSEKRKNTFTAGLNGYVGGNYGQEIATGQANKVLFPNESYYALSAPIGLSLNLGLDKISLGTFISLIDVGAITAYRFNDENTEELPEVTLGNIFSPGINIEIGYGSIPITLGVGQQWGPNLRKVTNTSLGIDEITTTRQNIYLRVDIPIIWF